MTLTFQNSSAHTHTHTHAHTHSHTHAHTHTDQHNGWDAALQPTPSRGLSGWSLHVPVYVHVWMCAWLCACTYAFGGHSYHLWHLWILVFMCPLVFSSLQIHRPHNCLAVHLDCHNVNCILWHCFYYYFYIWGIDLHAYLRVVPTLQPTFRQLQFSSVQELNVKLVWTLALVGAHAQLLVRMAQKGHAMLSHLTTKPLKEPNRSLQENSVLLSALAIQVISQHPHVQKEVKNARANNIKTWE